MIKDLPPSFRFLILFISLVTLWFTTYHNIYNLQFKFGEYDLLTSFSILLAKQSNYLLELFAFDTDIEIHGDMVVSKILNYDHQHGVWIGEPCNGVKIFGVFSIFILCFRKNWINKLWFIPLGIVLLHIINVLRVAILTFIAAVNPNLLNFNHNITFQLIIYASLLMLWFLYIKKFSDTK